MAADVWIKKNTAKMTVYPLATISAKAFYVFKLNTVGTRADLIIRELLIPFICFFTYLIIKRDIGERITFILGHLNGIIR